MMLLLFLAFCSAKLLVKAEDTNTGSIPVLDDYYEFTVPSSVTLKQNGNKLENTIDISVTAHQRKWLDVSITSQNNFNLVGENGKQKIPYTLSETSFSVEPQYPVDNDDGNVSKQISVTSNVTDIADDYSDTVDFSVSSAYETRTIVLDCNGGTVNGQSEVIYTVRDGSSYGKLPVPIKDKYNFLKWIDESGNTIYSGSNVISDTQKLTAVWGQQRSISILGFLNNNILSYTSGVATFDAYVNDGKIYNDSDQIYLVMYEGDSFLINDIKIKDGYKFIGMRNKFPYFNYQFDENGNLVSIEGTLTNSMPIYQQILINFDADNEINWLMSKTKTINLTIDSNAPQNVISVGNITGFACTVSAYVNNDTLHLYNPNGGKVVAPINSENLFSGCNAIKMDLRGLDTSNTINMANMFRPCSSMQTINVDGWDVSKVTTMAHIFADCVNLKSCDLSTWNTDSLVDMSEFFWSCHSLSSANITNLNTSNVNSFSRTFGDCYVLSDVDISKWNTHSATNMFAMFWNCATIKKLDISNFDTSKVTRMDWMLGNMCSLQEIKGLDNFNTSNVIKMDYMFTNYPLPSINLLKFNTSKLTTAENMFANSKIEELDLSSFDLSHLCLTTAMFKGCTMLKKIYISAKTPVSITSSNNVFLGCTNLVGGSGTVYDPTFIDATAARIDGGPNAPGYFTDIADKPTSSILGQVAQQTTDSEIEKENIQSIQETEEPSAIILQDDEEDPKTIESE